METSTWVILGSFGVYLLVMLWIGLRTSSRVDDLDSYITAGRNLPWFVLAFTFAATQANAFLVLGIPGFTYLNGLGFYLLGALGVISIQALLLPRMGIRMRNVDLTTLGDFAGARFPGSKRLHYTMAAWQVLWCVFITGITLYAGAVLIAGVTEVPWQLGVLIMAVVTIAYTVAGGLRAVVITDSIQWLIIILGTAVFVPLLFWKVGAYSTFFSRYLGQSGSSPTPAAAAAEPFSGFADLFTLSPALSYLPLLFAFFLAASLWILVDLSFAQRMLSARSMRDGLTGVYAFAIVIIFFDIPMIVLGMYGRFLYPNLENTSFIVPRLAQEYLPLLGAALFLTGIAAAAMSTVSSYLNAGSSIMVKNILMELRPGLSPRRQLLLARAFTVIVCLLALAITPFAAGGLVAATIAVQVLLTVALFPVVFLGLYWRRLTERAAFWGSVAAPIFTVILIFAGGGPSTVLTSIFFGVPTFFWGIAFAAVLFVGLSLLEPFRPENLPSKFREIFEGHTPRIPNHDLKLIGGIWIVLLMVFAFQELFGERGTFPPLSGAFAWLTDTFFVSVSVLLVAASMFLAVKLVGYIRGEVAPQNEKEEDPN